MKVFIIGSGSGIPIFGHFNESVLVEEKGCSYLFDAGEPCAATLHTNALLKFYGLEIIRSLPFIDIYSIKSIFISHSDADHIGGLPMLLQVMHLWQKRNVSFRFQPDNSIQLYLPSETIDIFRDLLRVLHLSTLRYELHIKPLEEGCIYSDELVRVSAIRNSHIRNNSSFSFILSSRDKRVAYSGDLGSELETADLVEEYVDLLIVECAHFNPERLCEVLRKLERNIGMVIVTHIHPSLYGREKEMEKNFSESLNCKVIIAKDHLKIEL
ncbi:hypothetical protein DRO35_00055 [Candidatus Bathyarchaeota archaeon]|nr:MAG: hypothetical protein DRO35_00055 [Candidatus Bathyarchaeota archaeon]